MSQPTRIAPPTASVKPPVRTSQPLDSSRVFLGLLGLSQRAAAATSASGTADVIATDILRSLLATLQFRDAATAGHMRRVAKLCSGMAQHLGCDGRQLRILETAALLHDLGKIGIPDAILFKPGSLSPREAELMALQHHVGRREADRGELIHQIGARGGALGGREPRGGREASDPARQLALEPGCVEHRARAARRRIGRAIDAGIRRIHRRIARRERHQRPHDPHGSAAVWLARV